MSAYPTAATPGMYRQMVVRIEYNLHHPTAGVRFVGCEPGDNVPTCTICGTNYSDILMYTLRMTLFLDQRVHGYRVWMDFGNDVPGKSTSLSPNASGISSPPKQPHESDHPIAQEVVLLSITANLSSTMNLKNRRAHQTFQPKNSTWKWLLCVRGNSSRR